MSSSINFGDSIYNVILPFSIGNIVWMKFIRSFEQGGDQIIHTPSIRTVDNAIKDRKLFSYLSTNFWEDFLKHSKIQSHENCFDHFDPQEYSTWGDMLDKVLVKISDHITRTFFEYNTEKNDCKIFNDSIRTTLFTEQEMDDVFIPYMIKETVAAALWLHPWITKRVQEIDAIDGIYTMDKDTYIHLWNPLGYAPVFLDKEIIADKNIMHIISFITSTIIVETKNCFKFTTSRTNQLKFFKI